jgi:hypothetical protein
MSQARIEELAPQYQHPADAAVTEASGKRRVDWAVLVVALALGCTLAWIYILFWVVVQAVQIALS